MGKRKNVTLKAPTVNIQVKALRPKIKTVITKSGFRFWWPAFILLLFLCVMEILDILGNWHTISLVAVTMIYVVLIYKSILNTIMLRREDRELDFKRRQLDWIVNWAREVRRQILIPIPSWVGIDADNLKQRLQNYTVENELVIVTAKIFGEEFQRIVEKAAKDLWAYVEALRKSITPPSTPFDHKSYRIALDQSFNNVLKSALKVESDLAKTSHM